jgi:ribosome-associated protein
MVNEYIQKEINKVMLESNFEFPLNMAMACAWLSAHFKGVNIKLYNVSNSSSLADYYLLCSTQNSTQAKTIADHICQEMKRHQAKILGLEGMQEADWVLIDLGDIIVHLFQESSRDIYDLDQLWMKYPQEKIPEHFYHAPSEAQSSSSSTSTKGYF